MIPLRLAEVVELTKGELRAAPGAEQITGVQVDSRRVVPGDLFVAVGRGAEFADDALGLLTLRRLGLRLRGWLGRDWGFLLRHDPFPP